MTAAATSGRAAPAPAGDPAALLAAMRERLAQAHAERSTLASKLARREALLTEARAALRLQAERLEADVAARTLALRQALDAAVAASGAKSSFLANMSHEIRTPLTSIIGFAELLLTPEGGGIDRADSLRAIVRNGRHLLDVVNDILDLAKIETGQVDVEEIPIGLGDLLRDLTTLTASRAEDKGLAFVVEPRLPLPARFVSDPVRLKQILLNFCSNAVKFTSHGAVRVRVAYDGAAQDLVFEVHDTGIGMSAEQLARLFQPFVQADASTTRRFGGTGLGLYLSRQLAEALGARVEAESRPGEGSCFRLRLPLRPPRGDDAWIARENELLRSGEQRPAFEVTDVAVPALGGRVLLAEDGIDNQRLLGAYLRQAGLAVTVAENGQRAVEAARAIDHDLVLMDMQMPVMDGLTAVRTLRRGGYRRPIVALTANVMKADVQRYREAGCDDVLSKPVDREQFYQVVSAMVGRKPPPPAVLADAAFERELAALTAQFRAGLPAQLEQMRDALTRADWPRLRDLVHTLKGTAGSYGYHRLTALAAAIERPLADGRTTRASVLCEELILEAREALLPEPVGGWRATVAAPLPAAR